MQAYVTVSQRISRKPVSHILITFTFTNEIVLTHCSHMLKGTMKIQEAEMLYPP